MASTSGDAVVSWPDHLPEQRPWRLCHGPLRGTTVITNNTRALHVLDARRSGQTLKQIAEKYGFTKERARQLSLRGLQIEREIVQNNVWFELSVRTRNAIIRNGCEPTPDAVVECYKTVGELRRIPGLGKKGIAELQAWLVRHARAART
jgi:hypothetical protein